MKAPSSSPAPTSEIVVYNSGGDLKFDVRTDGETVWLTQEQMCRLFGRTQPVIARHIRNAFSEGEVDDRNNMQILHINRRGQPLRIYDLDVVQQLAPPAPKPKPKIGF